MQTTLKSLAVAAATMLASVTIVGPAHANPKDGFIPFPPPVPGGVNFTVYPERTLWKPPMSTVTVKVKYDRLSRVSAASTNAVPTRLDLAKKRLPMTAGDFEAVSYSTGSPVDGFIPYPPPVPGTAKAKLVDKNELDDWSMLLSWWHDATRPKASPDSQGHGNVLKDFYARFSGGEASGFDFDVAGLPFPRDGVVPRDFTMIRQ